MHERGKSDRPVVPTKSPKMDYWDFHRKFVEGMKGRGLAKENEEIFIPGSPDPIILPRSSQALYLVQRIRDEANRFGITYHRKLRSDRTFKSVLDEIPSIGPKRKQALMKHYGSVRAMSAASVEDLAALDGMTRDAAEKVKEYIGHME